jgi:hypothetical protein
VPATYHHGVFRRLASYARCARSSSSSATFSVSSLATMPLPSSTFPYGNYIPGVCSGKRLGREDNSRSGPPTRDRHRGQLAGPEYWVVHGETDHATRALRCVIHGFALLQAANAFQWGNDPDESFAWMIRFVEAGLRGMGGQRE